MIPRRGQFQLCVVGQRWLQILWCFFQREAGSILLPLTLSWHNCIRVLREIEPIGYTHTHTHIHICVCVCVCIYIGIYIYIRKKSYDQPRQHIKKQRQYLSNKGSSSQSYDFSRSHDGCESWTIKKAEHQRIDPFEL